MALCGICGQGIRFNPAVHSGRDYNGGKPRPSAVRNDSVARKALFSEQGRYLNELGIIFNRAINVNGVVRAGVRRRVLI